jgi:GNAT superfamily N-acetyltransferase
MEIRAAKIEDSEAICALVRRSIVELCTDDHRDDPTVLALWLGNKTPETVALWLANPVNHMFVAVDGPSVCSVGCVTDDGVVTLNYVSPDARFRGASRALLKALEAHAKGLGRSEIRLESTITALRFYQDAGYIDDGPPGEKHGLRTRPMRKPI